MADLDDRVVGEDRQDDFFNNRQKKLNSRSDFIEFINLKGDRKHF